MMLLSYSIGFLNLFFDGAVDMQIWTLLTKSLCRVSDTRVTGKACESHFQRKWEECYFFIKHGLGTKGRVQGGKEEKKN